MIDRLQHSSAVPAGFYEQTRYGNYGKSFINYVFHTHMWKTIFSTPYVQGFTGLIHIVLVIIRLLCLIAQPELRILSEPTVLRSIRARIK
jgi:tetrahydromethanopterin S-methyltransferase subunit E